MNPLDLTKLFENSYFCYTKILIEQPLVENGEIKKTKTGNPKPDAKLRNYERVPLSLSIDEFFEDEIKPHLKSAWMERSKDKIGYEINFVKEFYEYKSLKDSKLIKESILNIDKEINTAIKEFD